MIHDWDGNGRKDDMFDNLMDYMLATGAMESKEEEEDEECD